MKVNLVTGRTLDQGEGLEIGKKTQEYQDSVCIIFLSEKDMEEMDISEGSTVEVSTDSGTVVVKCEENDLDPDNAFMPLGPWASGLLTTETSGVGIPQAKGIEAEVSKTDQDVKPIKDLVESWGGK